MYAALDVVLDIVGINHTLRMAAEMVQKGSSPW
jgi:hypothetical protein